jgi:uroporphyrinogen decarboxylase
MPDGALYFEQTDYPFAEREPDHGEIAAILADCIDTPHACPPGPLVEGPGGDSAYAEGARRLRTRTDRAIIGLFGGNLLETSEMLYRNDNFLAMLAGDPERAEDLLERIVQLHLSNLEKMLRAVGPYIDIVLFGDDLGMQTGPQMSPAMYRKFFKPRHARMWARAKELADVKVMLHCCGGVRELLPDLIEAGLDAINPVQISCRGMDASGLKRDFGGKIVFWGGGCDTREVLARGTPEDVRKHVREQVRVMRPGGGFVFQQVHNILADIPPQNIVAMFDAVRESTPFR